MLHGDPPAEGMPAPVQAVKLRALCGKELSASNPSSAYKNHKNCPACQQVGSSAKQQQLPAGLVTGHWSPRHLLVTPLQMLEIKQAQQAASGPPAATRRSSVGSSASTSFTEPPTLGGDEDVQLLADMTAAEAAVGKRQRTIHGFAWNKSQQREFELAWAEAAIADGDSFLAASSRSAKSNVMKRFFGLTLPHRNKMSGDLLNAVATQAEEERNKLLKSVGGFAVGFDGGRDKHMEQGSKMISCAGLMPNGGCVYLDTFNTNDCVLDADTYVC